MRDKTIIRGAAGTLALAALTGASGFSAPQAHAQIVADKTLSRARISGSDSCAQLTVDFNTSVQYQSHFPENRGQQLRISVRQVTGGGASFGGRLEEAVRPPNSDLVDIQSIRYDMNDPSGPKLVIDFAEDVTWSVQQGGDFTSIVINLARSPAGCGADQSAQSDDRDELVRLAAPVLSVSRNVPDNFDVNGVYALNLDSSPDPFRDVDLPANPVFDEYTAYTVSEQENGQTWNRLRLGFFSSRHDAEVAKEGLVETYPDSWVERTSRQERASVYNAWRAARTVTTGQSTSSAAIDEEAEAILAEARAALTNDDPETAVRLSQSILERPESRVTPQAQELLGLARERAGQLAHAKAEYEIYLEKYPSGEAADRVRQRLAVLISGEEGPTVSFAEDGSAVIEKEERSLRADISGSLSALYQRDQSTVRFEDTPIVGGPEVNPDPIEQDRVNLNEVVYAGDFTASIGNDRMEGLIRFSGVHRDDLRDEDPQDQSSISSLFMELSDRELGLTFRAGRQTRNTGGVFGRFDGALFSAEPTDWLRLNLVGGSPVQRSRDLFVQDDRKFIGTSADFTLLDEKLEATLYYLSQEWGELKDRESVGAEFRYFDAKNSAFGVLDYDTHYGEVNLALLSGTRRFEDNSSINLAVDFRRSPLLTTYNAIIGQGVEDPNDLFTDFTEEEIYQLANDRTATSQSAIVNFSKPLSENYQLNFDVTATETSATETSGGVVGFPATGPDFYYSAQIVASNLFKQGTIAVAGVRYADLETIEQQSVLLNARYPMGKKWKLSPRFRFDNRVRRDGSGTDRSARGSMRLTFDQTRSVHWETEIGGEWADGEDQFGTVLENEVFMNFGVRIDF